MLIDKNIPTDADERRAARPVTCYPVDQLPAFDAEFYTNVSAQMTKVSEVCIPPRDARTFEVPAGYRFSHIER